MDTPTLLNTGPEDASFTIVLAHGAGAPMDSPFMEAICERLAVQGFRTVRFEFPYMAKRRVDGKKRGPDQAKILLEVWRSVIACFDADRLVIGGKSLGGRIASMVAEETGVAGVICLGYPFHPPGKPERTRIQHLTELTRSVLILQGTRDPFGGPEEVAGYALPANIAIQWIEDGEHSFIPRKKSGRTESENMTAAVDAMVAFVNHVRRS